MLHIDFGVEMADGLNGVGLRAVELATALSTYTDVTVLAPDDVHPEICAVWSTPRYRSTRDTTARPGDVYWYGFATPVADVTRFRREGATCVFDAIVWPLEFSAYEDVRSHPDPIDAYRAHLDKYLTRLAVAHRYTVASTTERHVLAGLMSTHMPGCVIDTDMDPDWSFHVLPVGLSDVNEASLAGDYGYGTDAQTLLVWNGGTWNHYDPATAVRAVTRLRAEGLPVRLDFLYPRRGTPTAALRAAQDVTSNGDTVRFAPRGLGLADRAGILRNATAAVCVHPPSALWDLVPPMRLRETLVHRLPIIAPRRGALGDLIEATGIGTTFDDLDGLCEAVKRMTCPDTVLRMRQATVPVASDLTYESRAAAVWAWMNDTGR